jgi:hypothetical protein
MLNLVNIRAQTPALIEVTQHRVRQKIDRIRFVRASQFLLAQVQVFQHRAQLVQIRLPLAHGWPSFPASDSFVDGWLLSKHYAKSWLFPRAITGSAATACRRCVCTSLPSRTRLRANLPRFASPTENRLPAIVRMLIERMEPVLRGKMARLYRLSGRLLVPRLEAFWGLMRSNASCASFAT